MYHPPTLTVEDNGYWEWDQEAGDDITETLPNLASLDDEYNLVHFDLDPQNGTIESVPSLGTFYFTYSGGVSESLEKSGR